MQLFIILLIYFLLILAFVFVFFILPVFVLSLYLGYSCVISNKNKVLETLSGVDVQLRKRYDLISNVLNIAKAFMEHEKELFKKVTQLREEAINGKLGSKEKFEVEMQIDDEFKELMVNLENYPTLKSDETMVKVMKTYAEVEENISAARKFYNTALKDLRNSIQIFPCVLFKKYAGDVVNLNFFEADDDSQQQVNASQILGTEEK